MKTSKDTLFCKKNFIRTLRLNCTHETIALLLSKNKNILSAEQNLPGSYKKCMKVRDPEKLSIIYILSLYMQVQES